MDSFDEVLAAVQDYCKARVTAPAYSVFFQRLELDPNFDGAHVNIITRAEFIRTSLVSRYMSLLREAFSAVLGFEVEVNITVEAPAAPAPVPDAVSQTILPGAGQGNLGNYAFTFENFIVGPNNKFAHAAALAVAANPSGAYNPLFIYGSSGLGKTHLEIAIRLEIQKNHPEFNILYVDGEAFTNEIITAIRNNATAEFHQKYRQADVLLVDDIQFIGGKDSTQEEFFHTFNNIYEAGHQIVITSDRPPIEMSLLDDRLVSRFQGGLMADIQPPDIETRMVITRAKAAQLGLILDDDAVTCIAEKITTNVRTIEGVINRLTAYREILDSRIDAADVMRAIKDVARIGTFIPSPQLIIRESARYFSLSEEDLRGQNRSKNTATARQISMYLVRTLTNLPLKDIGAEYGDRNHSTVLSSIRKVEELIKEDPKFAATVRDITSNINSV